MRPSADLAITLTLLRVARGWTQDELAQASGVANSSISEYVRGRKVPELATLQRLLAAMGYPLGAIDAAQGFVAHLRSEAALSFLDNPLEGGAPAAGARELAPPTELPDGDQTAALRWEMEQVAGAAGRVVARLTRLLLLFLSRHAAPRAP